MVSHEELTATLQRMEARLSGQHELWLCYQELVPRFEKDLAASPRDVVLAKSAALMVVQALAHRVSALINIDVNDLVAATKFYCAGLELSVGRRFGDAGIELLGASSVIYLLVKPAGSVAAASTSQARDYARHWTPVHLDFVVPDIESAVARARAAGAALEGEIATYPWGRIALMADPFGHGFCLVQFLGRGYDEIATA
jgi:predicted enzyme related to lactoylglutathione lyase